jgi:subtilisin-like proprotein convertase family protein
VIHTFIGDLSIAVVSPAGTRVVLRDREGADADDLHQTWTPATTPALSDLMGQPFAGRWTLHLTDHAGQDTGRLDRWRLEVDPTAAPTVIEAAATLPAGGLAIPDAEATGITSTITVTQAAVLTQAQVTVDVRHSFIGDLVVQLTAPPAPSPPSTTAPAQATTTSANPMTQQPPRPCRPSPAWPPTAPGPSTSATSPPSTPATWRHGRCACLPEPPRPRTITALQPQELRPVERYRATVSPPHSSGATSLRFG